MAQPDIEIDDWIKGRTWEYYCADANGDYKTVETLAELLSILPGNGTSIGATDAERLRHFLTWPSSRACPRPLRRQVDLFLRSGTPNLG